MISRFFYALASNINQTEYEVFTTIWLPHHDCRLPYKEPFHCTHCLPVLTYVRPWKYRRGRRLPCWLSCWGLSWWLALAWPGGKVGWHQVCSQPSTWAVKHSSSGCLNSQRASQIFLPPCSTMSAAGEPANQTCSRMLASKSVSLMLWHRGANRYTKVCTGRLRMVLAWYVEIIWNGNFCKENV